ncbi:MAG: putative polyprenyl-phospho-glycoside--protein O-glycosyltransferase rane protein, partial [Deltaproteobacteria bacterium]|nr:putative polyprenyl-phospho-glycoside--protein O-glycosyltransferase rane protein [Deltaproteobacteria bacterium]
MLHSVLRRLDVFSILSFLLPLCIYLLTLAPSVTFFDSGEFITAISCLGSSHSPGYPLFINYAKPFTWLPFGSVAFRVNFATAISGALACYGAYLLSFWMLHSDGETGEAAVDPLLSRIAALAAALTLACSPRLWLQSNHDKPYPLVAFLVAIVLYLILRWRASYRAGAERPSYIYAAAFLSGLGTGAHQTIILMIPAYAFLILSMNWRIVFRIRDFIVALIFGVLGFAINLHLPIRASRLPLLNWGNPQTQDQFLWHFLRKGYPTERVERDLSLFWQQLNAFSVPYEFTLTGFLLMIIGMMAIFQRQKAEVIAYFLALFCFLLVIAGYFNTPLETIFLTEEFFTPLYLFSAVFVGIGIFFSSSKLLNFAVSRKLSQLPVKAVLIMIIFALPGSVCALNYVKNDQHLNYVAYDYASNVLRSAPREAVLYTWGDSGAFPLWYIQGVEKMREDLDLVHTPHLVFDWYLDEFPQLFKNSYLRRIPLESQSPENVLLVAVAEQYPRRPVLIDFSTRYSVPFGGYRLLQRGITYQ